MKYSYLTNAAHLMLLAALPTSSMSTPPDTPLKDDYVVLYKPQEPPTFIFYDFRRVNATGRCFSRFLVGIEAESEKTDFHFAVGNSSSDGVIAVTMTEARAIAHRFKLQKNRIQSGNFALVTSDKSSSPIPKNSCSSRDEPSTGSEQSVRHCNGEKAERLSLCCLESSCLGSWITDTSRGVKDLAVYNASGAFRPSWEYRGRPDVDTVGLSTLQKIDPTVIAIYNDLL